MPKELTEEEVRGLAEEKFEEDKLADDLAFNRIKDYCKRHNKMLEWRIFTENLFPPYVPEESTGSICGN
jgi:hypothetical protein